MIPSRVVVFQTAFLGDVILTIPIATALRHVSPESHIAMVVIPSAAPLVENHQDIAHVIRYDKHGDDKGLKGARKVIHALRDWNAGVAFVPHRSFRSASIVRFSGIPRRIGFTTSAASFLYTDKVRYRTTAHEIDRNLDLLIPCGVRPVDRILPTLKPNAHDEEIVDDVISKIPALGSSHMIAVAPGSVWATKRWVEGGYVEVSRRLAYRGDSVALIGGSGDEDLCRRIATGAGERVFSLAGSLTLMQSAAFLKRCRVLLTNDSAPQHLAGAVGTPVVSIFGPTVTLFGFSPIGPFDEVVENTGLYCRPCGIHGGDSCPIGTFDCMEHILPEQVIAALDRVIKRSQSSARTTIP